MKMISRIRSIDTTRAIRKSGLLCRLVTLAAIASVYLISTPSSQAAGADGSYKLTRVSGAFIVNNQTVEIPKSILANALLKNGRILVKDNKLPIYRANWKTLMDEFNYAGYSGTITITGPSNLLLKQSGTTYTGKTTKPVQLKLVGDFMGTDINVVMSMSFKATVKGGTMTITVPVTLNTMGIAHMNGTIKMVAKRS